MRSTQNSWFLSAALMLSLLGTESSLAQFTVNAPSRASKTLDGTVPSGTSGAPVAAPNANLFLFRSTAGNLVPNDTNFASDIFQFVPESGAVTRISVSSSGTESDADSVSPAISAIQPDGLFGVSFLSSATTLASFPNPNGINHVYLRLPTLSFTGLVSAHLDGTPANGDSFAPSITSLTAPNRIFVTFASSATNLAGNDSNEENDIFLAKFTVAGGTVSRTDVLRVTRSATPGTEVNGSSSTPQISADGRFIVFSSVATNLIANQTITSGEQIYLYDTATDTTTLISKGADGSPGSGRSFLPKISFKGEFITFLTNASNVVTGAGSSTPAVALYNTVTGITTRLNSDSSGNSSNGGASDVNLSASGRYVTFSDTGTNLVSGDTNGVADVFAKDLSTGAIVRISQSAAGSQTNGASDTSALGLFAFNSSFGRVGFRSFANNLVTDNSGNVGNVFASALSLPIPSLSPVTQIEAPADVTLLQRKATISVQQFGTILVSAAQSFPKTGRPTSAAAAQTVKYDIRFNKVGNKKERFQRISKRNTETFRKLTPGFYDVRYRAVVTMKQKTIFRTEFSPTRRIEVTKP